MGLDSEIIFNMTDKNNFLAEENNKKYFFKGNINTEDSNVNQFKAENENNLMSNSEFKLFTDDLQKIKAQLNILTSSNLANRNFQSFPPYTNNQFSAFPTNNYPNFPNQSSDKDKNQFNLPFPNNFDNSTEESNEEIDINNDNKNANVYNNFYSSNSMHQAMNFMHQGVPFLFPSSFQPFPFLNAFNHSNNIINKPKNKEKNKFSKENTTYENPKTNINNQISEQFDLDSSFTNLGNYCNNNLNENKNNKNDAIKANYDIDIPPTVNTFNMIFINTKINDVHLGYKGRRYNRKSGLATINEDKSNNIEEIKSDVQETEEKRNKKNKKDKKNNEKKETNEYIEKSNIGKKKEKNKKGKKIEKDEEKNENNSIFNNIRDNPYFARYAKIKKNPRISSEILNEIEKNDINVKAKTGDNYSEVSTDSLFN